MIAYVAVGWYILSRVFGATGQELSSHRRQQFTLQQKNQKKYDP